jgi:hypothetical protein
MQLTLQYIRDGQIGEDGIYMHLVPDLGGVTWVESVWHPS